MGYGPSVLLDESGGSRACSRVAMPGQRPGALRSDLAGPGAPATRKVGRRASVHGPIKRGGRICRTGSTHHGVQGFVTTNWGIVALHSEMSDRARAVSSGLPEMSAHRRGPKQGWVWRERPSGLQRRRKDQGLGNSAAANANAITTAYIPNIVPTIIELHYRVGGSPEAYSRRAKTSWAYPRRGNPDSLLCAVQTTNRHLRQ